MTIHKSQGLTFKSVLVGMDECLDRATIYVACSRATSITGLHLWTVPGSSRNSIMPLKVKKMKQEEGFMDSNIKMNCCVLFKIVVST